VKNPLHYVTAINALADCLLFFTRRAAFSDHGTIREHGLHEDAAMKRSIIQKKSAQKSQLRATRPQTPRELLKSMGFGTEQDS
jgi:hypothetical protein